MKNKFYITNSEKDFKEPFTAKKSWVDSPTFDKQPLNGSENEGVFYPIDVTGVSKLSYTFEEHRKVQGCTYTFLDNEYNKVGFSQWVPYMYDTSKDPNSNEYEVDIPSGVSYVAITVLLDADISSTEYGYKYFDFKPFYSITPHYKSLKIDTKKENGQVFFRDTIDGKIMLHRDDCDLVMNADLESQFYFYLYQDNKLVIKSKFSKTDCKFDSKRHSAELGLEIEDNYSTVIDKYENTYDLFKLSVAKTKATLTKRAVVQLYVVGDKTVSSYIDGTVYEHEVSTPVYDVNTLQQTYYFGDPETYKELSLSGFKYNINTSAILRGGELVVNSAKGGNQQFSLVFEKVFNKGDAYPGNYWDSGSTAYLMSNVESISATDGNGHYIYDIYKIHIYSEHNGEGTKLFSSIRQYANDNNLTLDPSQNYEFNIIGDLSKYIITHRVCMRILCDVPVASNGKSLYDLPHDDFAIGRLNYKYCIGANFENSGVHIINSSETQAEPTPYGLTEFNQYFAQPEYIQAGSYMLYPFPLAKSSWSNISLWVGFENFSYVGTTTGLLEKNLSVYNKQFVHKDAMEIGAVIKALLNEIDPSIIFDCTEEFSSFLYPSNPSAMPGTSQYNQKILISQKSNILKGEYDQPAQKAEITLKSMMELLRDGFRCYWYIDNEKRFRIEHIVYFMNGLSYNANSMNTVDLTTEKDKFNGKLALYAQNKISYVKSELTSRYEFSWGDNQISEAMGSGFSVDIKSNFVKKDKKENISLQNFSSDIDMMFYMPDSFSQDGFALFTISNDGTVPIEYIQFTRAKHKKPIALYCQNVYMSFLHLFENYEYDLPARPYLTTTSNNEKNAIGEKKTKEHDIVVCTENTISPYSSIVSNYGAGTIEAMKRDIDTGLAEITLRYKPS